MFALISQYAPPLPPGISSPVLWGDVGIIRERLGVSVTDILFARDVMLFPTLSIQHYRHFMESNLGPIKKVLQGLDASDPAKSTALRLELERLAASYFANNMLRQDYLLTRAVRL
jgi:hypothetical protein